jgi:ribosomal protein S12 methylthiotransferase accessory factor
MFSAKLIAESGNPLWAIGELESMDAMMPGKYYVQFFLGTSYLAAGDPVQALKHLETALALDPRDEDIASIYSYMGQCLKETEQYGEAIKTLERGNEYDRERTDIHNLMGYCFFKLKDHEKAIQCFKNVLDLDPSSAIDYANIASNYRDMGDREQAVRYYRLALELDPSIDFARESLEKLEDG